MIRIYNETSALESNIRHPDDKTVAELAAVRILKDADAAGRVKLEGSNVNRREVDATANVGQRASLTREQQALSPILKDELFLGANTQYDQLGGFIANVFVSDTQDDNMRDRIIAMGVRQKRDAEHLTQAICNGCDYFLTRDKRTIIPYRDAIEAQYPPIKIRLPMELVEELTAMGAL
jgi:hypothetical protein